MKISPTPCEFPRSVSIPLSSSFPSPLVPSPLSDSSLNTSPTAPPLRSGPAGFSVGLVLLFHHFNLCCLTVVRNLFRSLHEGKLTALMTVPKWKLGKDRDSWLPCYTPCGAQCGGGALWKGEMEDVEKPKKLLLPPREFDDQDRLTVVLDLDETLVCAYCTAGLPPMLQENAMNGRVKTFTLDCQTTEPNALGAAKVSNVTVFERPGLAQFLDRVSEFAEVVLFTAGLEGYAKPLVDRIDLEKRISHRLYRPATVLTLRENVKDLSLLGRDLRRCVIVDNNPFAFLLQPLNGIPAVPFTGHHAQDGQLLHSILPLLEELASAPDVRPILSTRFNMRHWFHSRGVPVLPQ
eukprot:TRINITY_DN30374_c0_g1_i1.p1 TRINITY_DN30374_c0_g1~~TRINITY_DN30374_c0_g1_i1.p1  ORF type:complete len:349 (+),score=42.23 TRINITY_DN30374_c0_g1_i1:297-1343(+)